MEHLKYIGTGFVVLLSIAFTVGIFLGILSLMFNFPWLGGMIALPFFIVLMWFLGKDAIENRY